MATQLFTRGPVESTRRVGFGVPINGSIYHINARIGHLHGTRGIGASSLTVATASGPVTTLGLAFAFGGGGYYFLSDPVAAPVTISGSITFNIRAAENSMTANAGLQVNVYRVSGETLTQIISSKQGVELGTSEAARNWSAAPDAGVALAKGDRILVWVAITDAGGTMASGFTCTMWYAGPTSGASGDSFVTFTENITFMSVPTTPSGSAYYLRATTSPINPNSIDSRDALTTAGVSTTQVARTTTAPNGPISYGFQITATAGGTAIEWYTPELDAFTLSGVALAVIGWSATSSFHSVKVEIAVVNSDGSGATVWAFANSDYFIIGDAASIELVGPDLAVSSGQRLRLRAYLDDGGSVASLSGKTVDVIYDRTVLSGNATRLVLEESVTEYVGGGGAASSFPPVRPGQGIRQLLGR